MYAFTVRACTYGINIDGTYLKLSHLVLLFKHAVLDTASARFSFIQEERKWRERESEIDTERERGERGRVVGERRCVVGER